MFNILSMLIKYMGLFAICRYDCCKKLPDFFFYELILVRMVILGNFFGKIFILFSGCFDIL